MADSAAYPQESLFAPAFPRIEEIRTENVLGDVSAKDIAWLCEVAEAAARLCVYMSQVEPMVFKRNAGCERWNRLAGLLQPQTEKLIFPKGDERCDFVMDACTCMKRKGHEGLHACAHGGWRSMPDRQESPAASLHEQAEQRVYTNDLDALEALIVEGLPPDEMQAAAWVLVQRVRGLQADLVRVEKARAAWAARAAR